jgi:hypothetical protein
MGQPIEEAARKASTPEGVLAGEDAGAEFDAAVAARREQLIGDAGNNDTSTPRTLVLAQQRFIAAQTAFLHNQTNLGMMFQAQMDYLAELAYYVSTQDKGLALAAQERYIADMQDIIQKRGLI